MRPSFHTGSLSDVSVYEKIYNVKSLLRGYAKKRRGYASLRKKSNAYADGSVSYDGVYEERPRS